MASHCDPSSDNSFGPAVQDCRSNFDFTLLFEQSILSIGPAVLFLLFTPPRFVKLLRSSKKIVSRQIKILKGAVSLVLIGLQLGLLICWALNPITRTAVPAACLSFFAALSILPLSRLEESRSVKPSTLINVYLLLSIVFDVVQTRTLFIRHDESRILGLLTASIVVKIVLLFLESRSKRRYLAATYNEYPPEATSGIFSKSLFWWLNPILASGFNKFLTLDDLFQQDQELLSDALGHRMQRSWSKYRISGRWAIAKAVFHCLRWQFVAIIFPRLCLIGFSYAQPFLISAAIENVSQKSSTENDNAGYGIIGATALIYLGIAVSTAQYQHKLYRTATAFRGAMISLIFAKTLEIQAGIYDESAAVTLMSTDIDRLTESLRSLCEIWARLIEIIISMWLLGSKLGWVCVAPIILVIVSIFCSAVVTKIIGPRQKVWIQAVQTRVAITSSMLGYMKSVKMMGLSNILSDTVQNQRVLELDLSKKFRVLGFWRLSLSFVPTILGPLATFVIFAIQAGSNGSDRLTASQTFSSLAIISLLTTPASEFLISLPLIGMSTACLDRIQKFLLSESCVDRRLLLGYSPPQVKEHLSHGDNTELVELNVAISKESGSCALEVENATIRPSTTAPAAIHNNSFSVEKGSITMVIGVVGSGKSTLLKAIAGELQCESGSISISSKSVAYCAQTPWLPNSSVRNIICETSDIVGDDNEWYRKVVHSCALEEDILDLPDLDETIIGSRGVVLSGGQKQRLALARAVYARRSVYILDDVLSAVDARTESLIVDRLFGEDGIFRELGATVLLATHAVRHLPLSDKIIALDADGSIMEQGSFRQLNSGNGFVSQLLLRPDILNPKSSSISDSGANSGFLNLTSVPKAVLGQSESDKDDLSRRVGDVSVYMYYIRSIGWKVVLSNIFASFVYMVGAKFPPLWLTWYADGTVPSLAIFASIYALSAVVAFIGIAGVLYTLFMKFTPLAGAELHRILLRSVMQAPQSFFDKTDSGVLLNRFSQDMTLIDGALPACLVMTVSSVWQSLAQFALIAVGSTYMAAVCPFLVAVVYFLQKFYLRTSRQIRFLDLEYKSPLYTHFTETVEGLSTIRAFGWQHQFIQRNTEKLDTSQRPYYLLFCIQRWLNLVLELIVGVMAVIVVALATSLKNTTNPGRLGVAMSAVVTFNTSLSALIQYWTAMETSLGAVARVKGFEEGTASEHKEEETFVPPDNWPTHGAVDFKDVSASYGTSPALRNVTFSIKPGEKIGICGRTGSGKSTLLSVLLRLLDLDSGTITIDGINLQHIPRETIRLRLITIPQEPFILIGSVRRNADPTSSSTDTQIITALTKVGLWTLLSSRGGLDAEMTANPLSQGQQQIFCLARAILRTLPPDSSTLFAQYKGGKIVILDEATSNVDAETDKLMQRVIREEFRECTLVCVAHRLETIRDADRVLVLEKGKVIGFGEPGALLEREMGFWDGEGGEEVRVGKVERSG